MDDWGIFNEERDPEEGRGPGWRKYSWLTNTRDWTGMNTNTFVRTAQDSEQFAFTSWWEGVLRQPILNETGIIEGYSLIPLVFNLITDEIKNGYDDLNEQNRKNWW